MKNLNGWQVVILVGMVLTALVVLVKMGQGLGAIVGAALLLLGGLGVPIYQNAVNSEKINQGNMLANGNLAAMRDQITALTLAHAAERAELIHQIQASNHQAVALAAMVPPDSKVPEERDGV